MIESIGFKIKAALYTTLVLAFFFFCMDVASGEFPYSSIVSLVFTALGNVFYGIPVSYLADYISRKADKHKYKLSALVYLLFGYITTIFIGFLSIYAIFSSLMFFLIIERLRELIVPQKQSLKTKLSNGLTIAVLFTATLFVSFETSKMDHEEKSMEYYLLPEGYVGQVMVVHNVEHAPAPQKINGYDLIRINQKGYGITQLPPSKDLIINKYVYINREGRKIEMEQGCIELGGIQTTTGDYYEYTSSYFTVTRSCYNISEIDKDKTFQEELTLEEILLEENLAVLKNYIIVPKNNLN